MIDTRRDACRSSVRWAMVDSAEGDSAAASALCVCALRGLLDETSYGLDGRWMYGDRCLPSQRTHTALSCTCGGTLPRIAFTWSAQVSTPNHISLKKPADSVSLEFKVCPGMPSCYNRQGH